MIQSKGAAFFYHDFIGRTDLTFQGATGSTPADDSGEAVAMAFGTDEIGSQTIAQVVAAQSELIPATSLTTGAFWNSNVGVTFPGATAEFDANLDRAARTGALVTGRTYRYSVTLVQTGSASLQIDNNGASGYLTSPTPTGTYTGFFVAVTDAIRLLQSGTGSLSVTAFSVKEIPGYHSVQSGSTSLRPTRQADGSLKGDRLDDNLLQRLTSSTSMFMAAALLGASTPAATAAIIGGPVSTTRGYLARDAAGKLCAGVGADGPATIVGGSDIAGLKGVAMLNIDASGNVDLEWMPKGGALVSLYSAPINGAVAAGTALRLFATNPSGTAANFGGDSLYLASAIQTTLTPAERRAIAKDWNARIPS
jgi:hypothetical protein